MITVQINGEKRVLRTGASIPLVIQEFVGEDPGRGIAVALNGEVVRRADWPAVVIHENDAIEIVKATQGG